MTREELIDLVNRIILIDGTEEEVDEMIDVFENNISDPEARDYLFSLKYDGLKSAEIVDKALSYMPPKLPAPNPENKE